MSNPRGNPNWQPGASGNPAGRPPKSRALTTLLEAAGNQTHPTPDGKRVAGKRLVAAGLWEGVATGTITLAGKALELEPGDWLALVKWLYTHIDGPPKAEIDVRILIQQEAARLALETGTAEADILAEFNALVANR